MLIRFNKPYGVLSQFTPEGRWQGLKDFIDLPGVYVAGRLDADSEGLLLLTDDGQQQAQIADPRFKMEKTYWVQVDGLPTESALAALRQGEPLYLLPDMNFGPHESVFVPFYGVPACTVPSLSRFARLGRAQVVPVVTRMTPQGYDVEVMPAWDDFPTTDATADTATMNLRLQAWIDTMPEQYYWVHKRFKDRPEGEPSVY